MGCTKSRTKWKIYTVNIFKKRWQTNNLDLHLRKQKKNKRIPKLAEGRTNKD